MRTSWPRWVVAASGDIGYTSGRYEMSAAGSTEKGKYVTVWRKEGDAWKVTEDIFNADVAPPHWHPGVENLTVISGTIALGDDPSKQQK